MAGTPAKKATPSLASIINDEESRDTSMDPVQPVDSEAKEVEDPNLDVDENYEDEKDHPFMSPEVVHMASNKTPAELVAETPEETAKRYNIDNRISDEDADNPRVQVYRDTLVNQVPSGTHLHPDVAKDLLNRGIAEQHTDNAQVKRVITDTYDFAPDAETNDKF